MVWTRKAKLRFYWERRRHIVKTYVKSAELLGTSVKRARKKAVKDLTKEYRTRKDNYKEINSIGKVIARMEKRGEKKFLSKGEINKLAKLKLRQDKLIRKTSLHWLEFEDKIGYKTRAEKDIEEIKKGS